MKSAAENELVFKAVVEEVLVVVVVVKEVVAVNYSCYTWSCPAENRLAFKAICLAPIAPRPIGLSPKSFLQRE